MKVFRSSLVLLGIWFSSANAARAMEVTALGDFMLSNITSSPGEQNQIHFSFGGGAEASFDLTPLFQLEIGALYLPREVGSTDSGSVLVETFPYVTIPVLLRMPLGPVILGLGGYYAYGLSQINVEGNFQGVPFSGQVGWSQASASRSDYGLAGAVGYRQEILPLIDLTLDARYLWGLHNFDTTGTTTSRWRNIDLLVGLGFRI